MEMEMRATEDIGIGEDITPPLFPLSYALHDSFLHSHCSSCFSSLPNANPYHHLPSLLYCSSLCSSSHFSAAEIHLLRSSPSASSDLRAALRLLHPHSIVHDGRISGLLTNHAKLMADEEISASVKDGARAMAAATSIEMGGNGQDAILLEAALCLVLMNAVEVHDKEGRSLGIAVYAPTDFSWINHSCSPNACYRFLISPQNSTSCHHSESRLRILPAGNKGESDVYNNNAGVSNCGSGGPRVIVRSIKRIKKDEEVTVAYTDLLQPKAVRQSELWSKYRFSCCCARCSESPQAYVDHCLEEILTSNLTSSRLSSDHNFYRDAATKKLTDYVDEVIAEYLDVGDPEACCKKLEDMLILGLLDEQLEERERKSKLNFRLHPLHHLALNTYTTLASAYRIRASDLLALHTEVGGRHLEVLTMSRISAAYSLLLAAVTYHLFCFESSLMASVANFWTNAGDSLLALARNPAWNSLCICGLPLSNLSRLGEHKCSNCSLLDRFEDLSPILGQIDKADFGSVSNAFVDCISSLSQKAWGFLIQDCSYLKMIKNPVDLRWFGESLNVRDFEARLASNRVDTNCWTKENIYGLEAQGCTNQCRINIVQLGVHCLLFGGFLGGICYGPHSHWINHIRSTLNYEGM